MFYLIVISSPGYFFQMIARHNRICARYFNKIIQNISFSYLKYYI